MKKLLLGLLIFLCLGFTDNFRIGYYIVHDMDNTKYKKEIVYKEDLKDWLSNHSIDYKLNFSKTPYYEIEEQNFYFYIEEGTVFVKKNGKLRFKHAHKQK